MKSMEILGEECVTHTGVLRNPKWISLSPSYSCARVKTSRMCLLSFRAQQLLDF
jgi:hypothetical protein